MYFQFLTLKTKLAFSAKILQQLHAIVKRFFMLHVKSMIAGLIDLLKLLIFDHLLQQSEKVEIVIDSTPIVAVWQEDLYEKYVRSLVDKRSCDVLERELFRNGLRIPDKNYLTWSLDANGKERRGYTERQVYAFLVGATPRYDQGEDVTFTSISRSIVDAALEFKFKAQKYIDMLKGTTQPEHLVQHYESLIQDLLEQSWELDVLHLSFVETLKELGIMKDTYISNEEHLKYQEIGKKYRKQGIIREVA